MGNREQWGSKLGFILAAAGSAVGLGNIWKFPYVTGNGGGAAFVLVYLLIVAIVGFTVMAAEMALGRATQKNCIGAFKELGGGAWSILGVTCILCPIIICSYYVIIGGWTVKYFVLSFTGLMPEAVAGNAGKIFESFITNSGVVIAFSLSYIFLTAFVVYRGIGSGIERLCKILMPTLFLILIILSIRSVTLPNSSEGLKFFLRPDFSKFNSQTLLVALGQAFFSLSLGMGIMITYGSYLRKDENIPRATVQVCALDTLVALLAGLIIFPATSAFGVAVNQGPGLAFVTLPSVFAQMPAGFVWSALFFALMFFAALTSSISLLEVPVSYLVDKGVSRQKATILMTLVITALSIPSSLSLNGSLQIAGKGFFDVMGFLTDNLLMPLNALAICIFAGWYLKRRIFNEVTNNGTCQFGLRHVWWFCLQFIAPIAILYIFITGLHW